MTHSDRFLDAYERVAGCLRAMAGLDKSVSFRGAVRSVGVERLGRSTVEDLYEFAELRNAIVHTRRNGEVIAEPHERVVERFEEIRRILEAPPNVLALCDGRVTCAGPDDRLGETALKMRLGNISQVPVYVGISFVGLLTTDTIARWIAAMLAGGVGLVEEAPVSDVLAHTEDPEQHCYFVRRDATTFEALAAYHRYEDSGHRLDAILVTHSGDRNQVPLGIMTSFDLPALLRAAGGDLTWRD